MSVIIVNVHIISLTFITADKGTVYMPPRNNTIFLVSKSWISKLYEISCGVWMCV